MSDDSSRAPVSIPRFDEALQSVEAAGMFPWQWDIASDRIHWSKGIDDLFGAPRGEASRTYEASLATVAAEDRATVTSAIERVLRGETEDYNVEHRVGETGSERWVASRGRVFRDAGGRPIRMAGVVWDITARKTTEASVARLNRLWSVVREINKQILHGRNEGELFTDACRIAVEIGLFRFAWVGLVTKDGARVEPAARWGHEAGYLDSVRVEVADTPRGRGPTGTAVREGRPWITNDSARDPRFEPWRAAAAERGYRSCGAFPLRRGGSVVGALNVYADREGVFDDEQSSLLNGLADDLSYALDVLDREERRRTAEEAMRSSEERYRAVFQQAFEYIFLVAPTRRIIEANESACRALGYTREELLLLRAEDVVHKDDLAAAPLRFDAIPAGGVILSERRFVGKRGAVIHVELSTKALLDGNFQVVARDVSERKAVEAELLLADRMASLGRLAAGVAHEVNNPLAYLMLNLEMLANRLDEVAPRADRAVLERMRRGLDDARDGAERVRRIVRMLTTFGRGDEERVGPVDVNAVLESALRIAGTQIRHRAELTRHYEATVPVSANAFRLGQVFVNLLVNAADALPDNNPENAIALRTYVRADGSVVVEVRDNGVGIPREVESRIFDPFFTTKAIGKGTGLGLAVSHGIVTSFGGEIACESAPGEGATFRVVLRPASDAPEREAPPGAPRAPFARGRVLVVDDDDRLAKAIATALDDHDVLIASSGRDALARCRAETFDCVLCDLMMPEISGVDVYDELLRDGRGAERSMIFMTGGALSEPFASAIARAPNRVLEKPIDAPLLRAAVAAAVERAIQTRHAPQST